MKMRTRIVLALSGGAAALVLALAVVVAVVMVVVLLFAAISPPPTSAGVTPAPASTSRCRRTPRRCRPRRHRRSYCQPHRLHQRPRLLRPNQGTHQAPLPMMGKPSHDDSDREMGHYHPRWGSPHIAQAF
jgi:hypothetical protein